MYNFSRCFAKVLNSSKKIMPKKFRKNKQKNVPIYKNILTLDVKEHTEIVRGLSEMFPSFDSNVIKLIVDESENNVEQALETLISLSSSDCNTSCKEHESAVSYEFHDEKKVNLSNISKIFEKSLCMEPDDGMRIQDAPSCSATLVNLSDSFSYPQENFESIAPKFIVPTAPMHGTPSPHNIFKLEANRALWNVPDRKHYSTSASRDSPDRTSSIKKAFAKIQSSSRVLIILRGLPGSGKSSLAVKLKFSGVIFSSDDFFMKRGRYIFDPALLPEAHAWNKIRTKKAMEKGISPIIIDNTNVEAWEIKPYALMGKTYNYEIIILEPNTPWKFNVKELAFRNKHGVPKSTIAKMKERYDKNVTIEKLLATEFLLPKMESDCNEDHNYCMKDHRGQTVSDVDPNSQKESCISLEAVIHREESSFDQKPPSDNDFQLIEPNSEESTGSQSVTVCNLDELRSLAKNDSEDSQSSYHGSLQEIANWDSITEVDNEFRWSKPTEPKLTKSKSADCLSCKESSDIISFIDDSNLSSSTSVDNLSTSEDNSSVVFDKECPLESNESGFHSHQTFEADSKNIGSPEKNIFSKSDMREHSKIVFDAENFDKGELWPGYELIDDPAIVAYSLNPTINEGEDKQNSKSDVKIDDEAIDSLENNDGDLDFAPKPCRNNNISLTEDKFLDQKFLESCKSKNYDVQWNISNNKTENATIEEKSIEKVGCSPKPQRKNFESKFSEIKNNENNKKSFLNISLESNWKFPEFIQDDSERTSLNYNKKALCFKMSTPSQTETRDFDLMHQIAVGNSMLDYCNYKIIAARPNIDIFSENVSKLFFTDVEETICPEIISFDKSTSTDDLVDDLEISQKLAYLQECFPDISKEDLLHNLEICHNNERWLSNLLLDWGYKYNVPENNFKASDEEIMNGEKNGCEYNFVSKSEQKECAQAVNKNASDNSSDFEDGKSSSSNNAPEDTKEIESERRNENKEVLSLILDPGFARQLEEYFGPVSNSADRRVDIDLELAEIIYRKWKVTNNDSKQVMKAGKKCKYKQKMKYTPSKLKSPKEPSSFSEIMDQELAIQLHREEKLSKEEGFETKLKRVELYNMFPGADTVVLDEIFESNNCSLKKCLLTLGEGKDKTDKEIRIEKKKVKKIEDDINLWRKSQIFQEFETGNWSDWVYKEEDKNSNYTEINPFVIPPMPSEAAELREEAVEQYRLRLECVKKSQRAFHRGMNDVASFYAQQGREHGELSKIANQEASALIAKARNSIVQGDSVDLHSLYTKEAITLLDKFLKDKKSEIKRYNRKTPFVVSVITGKGNHSIQGPKIQPAVENFLKSNGYHYFENTSGKFDVTILPD